MDKSGKRGDEPRFDKSKVAVYGLGLEGSGNGQGQTQWSFLTATTGWTADDKNPWGTKFNYDDPKFQETIGWWDGLADKGYMPQLETTVGASSQTPSGPAKPPSTPTDPGRSARTPATRALKPASHRHPKGTEGKRASMYNGSPTPSGPAPRTRRPPPSGSSTWLPATARRCSFEGRGLPCHQELLRQGCRCLKAKNIDVSAFTTHVKDGATCLFPITENAAKVDGLMAPAMDAVLSGKKDASTLGEATEKVNNLFK